MYFINFRKIKGQKKRRRIQVSQTNLKHWTGTALLHPKPSGGQGRDNKPCSSVRNDGTGMVEIPSSAIVECETRMCLRRLHAETDGVL